MSDPHEEDDGDADLDAIFDDVDLPPDMPPEIAKILFEETGKAVQRGESLDSLINRLFGPTTGFGGKRKKALLLHFGSAKAVAEAGVSDLQKVAGISKTAAEKIYGFFHEKDD